MIIVCPVKIFNFFFILKKVSFIFFKFNALGLSCFQFGIYFNLFFIFFLSYDFFFFLNVLLIWRSNVVFFNTEGCLSIVGNFFVVPRYKFVVVFCFDSHLKFRFFFVKDFYSSILQHEIDHSFNLFISRFKIR